MQATLYCFYDIFDGTKHDSQEVFIISSREEDLSHIASPAVPRKSPLAEAIYGAIIHNQQKFRYNGNICTILSYRNFKSGYTRKYKNLPTPKKKKLPAKHAKKKPVKNVKSMSKRLSMKSSLCGLNGNAYQPYQGGRFTSK